MTIVRGAVGAAMLLASISAWAQERPAAPATRLAGVVTTTSGATHAGTIRWDSNEAFVDDRIDTGLALPDQEERRGFGFNLFGFKIGGGAEPPRSRPVSLPFGAVRRLEFDDPVVRATLTDGETLVLVPRGSDLGPGCRGVVVGTDDGDVELDCVEVAELALREPRVAPHGERVWGTVHAVDGGERSGWIVWDRDEALAGDVLDGHDEDDAERAVPLGTIASVERRTSASRLVLKDGAEVVLSGTNDVARGHRGVAVTVPGRGVAEIDWEDVVRVDFGEPPDDLAPPAFAGGAPAVARLTTRDGTGPAGRLVWDGVPRYAFETIDARAGAFTLRVPLERLAALEPDGGRMLLRYRDGGEDRVVVTDIPVKGVAVEHRPRGEPAVPWVDLVRVDLKPE